MLAFFVNADLFAQQLPLGACGIVNTYDANGNRLRRLYYCNNGGLYPNRTAKDSTKKGEAKEIKIVDEFQIVDALYPNPTTGVFFVTFSKQLKNAKVYLTDMNGKIIRQFIGNGYKLTFDLSTAAAGVYLMRIEDNDIVITKKVVKQ